MGIWVERTDRKLYPSCISEIVQPLDGSAAYTWKEVCAYAMGADMSGYSGAIVNGKLICSGEHNALNTWMMPPE